MQNDTSSALHIEPLHAAIDPRVRTGRVDYHYRAVLFRVDDKSGGTTYIYMGTWPHDEANKLAERATLRVNPINGTLEGLIGESAAPARSPGMPCSSPRPTELSYLASVGYTLEDLTDRLGIDSAVAERAMAAADESALVEAAEGALDWEGSALLDLATGIAIEIDPRKARIHRQAGRHRPRRGRADHRGSGPASVEDAVRLSSRTTMSCAASSRVATSPPGGHSCIPSSGSTSSGHTGGPFRLSGGAGTGKTVVAIHRARRLARENPSARIILTTFNTALADGLKADLAGSRSRGAYREQAWRGRCLCRRD